MDAIRLYMESLPDELHRHIYKFVFPCDKTVIKYSFSILWCKKCGERFRNGNWCLHINQYEQTTMFYECNSCFHDNIFTDELEWASLLDLVLLETPV